MGNNSKPKLILNSYLICKRMMADASPQPSPDDIAAGDGLGLA
jgi:hypothetical protein